METVSTCKALQPPKYALGNKLQLCSEILVLFRQPLKEVLRLGSLLHLQTSILVQEFLPILLTERGDSTGRSLNLGVGSGGRGSTDVNNDLGAGGRAEGMANDIEILPDDEGLDGSHLESMEGVVDAEAVLARVVRDLVEVALDQPAKR